MHNLISTNFFDWISHLAAENNFSLKLSQIEGVSIVIIPEKAISFAFIKLKDNEIVSKMIDLFYSSNEGFQLISVWEDQWIQSNEVIRSRISSLLGQTIRIHGRATKVKRIDIHQLNNFLATHHLNVITTAKYKYGLFFKDELVAVASFSAGKPMPSRGENYRSYELIRFANLKDHTVVGGLSKLIKFFIEEVKPSDIMTYADLEWSNGEGYVKLGFKKEGITESQQFWVKEGEWLRYYAHKLPLSILSMAESNESEEQLMIRLGYVRIKNQGNLKFRLVIK
ncbi:hypothetical protein NF867_00645 [Solitalea sp. MAHUQ-68]|uniref:Uncharacterized protein n=1 Tax=Solitalea agri TaxID=2953739 RepID=A0A9X2JAW8_9SPHI|nr:hypothetical protein [Solitalea agri]MCO4291368.1 hypothetical protein [Solitalea agri]